jgi:hypothetical protein
MRSLLALVSILLLTAPVAAGGYGGHAGSFLSYGGGAREVAMGGNLCAAANDAGALLWNPATLVLVTGNRATATHGLIDEDRSRNFLALAMPLGRFNLGAGWLNAGTDGIQERSETGERLDEFDDSESALMLGAATRVYTSHTLDLMLGAAFRYFRHSLLDNTGTGSGLDIGTAARFAGWRQVQSLVLAASIHNLGADISWDTESNHSDTVPTTLHTGIAVQLVPFNTLLTGSLTRSDELDTRAHLGLEIPVQTISLRMGLDDGDLAAGFGLPVKAGKSTLLLDYGYRNDEITDSMLHFFSVGLLY